MDPDIKPLVISWLEEMAVDATKKGTRAATLYVRSLDSIRRFPSEVTTPAILRSIPFIGAKTVALLLLKLRQHCIDNSLTIPAPFAPPPPVNASAAASTIDQPAPKKRRKASSKPYIPNHRLGGYAILIALHIHDPEQHGLSRQQIVKYAAPYSEKSFTSNPANRDFYSAWNLVQILEKHDLVAVSGRSPKIYTLTHEGAELAAHLRAETLATQPDTSADAIPTPIPPPTSIVEEPTHVFEEIPYLVWPHGSYDIHLLIDTREIRSRGDRDFFQSRLASLGVVCEVRALPVGDALWVARHRSSGDEAALNYVCERKKLDDLAFSIKDGRFQEQKHRLKQMGAKHAYYLVEEGGLDRAAGMMELIKTAIAATMAVHGFLLRRLKDPDETVSLLASLTACIREKMLSRRASVLVIRPRCLDAPNQYRSTLLQFRAAFENNPKPSAESTAYECCHSYSLFSTVLAKTGQMSVLDMYILMLMAVRGVLLERAVSIYKAYPTPRALLEAYQEAQTLGPSMLQERLKVLVGNKKIGPAVLQAVCAVWGSLDSAPPARANRTTLAGADTDPIVHINEYLPSSP